MLSFPVRARSCLGVLALALAASADPAQAQFVRTGASVTGGFDDNWSVDWYGVSPLTSGISGSLSNAAIVTMPPSPPWAPNIPGVQQWIGVSSNGTVSTVRSSGVNYRYFFQTTYTQLLAGSTSFGIGWDNQLVGAFVGDVTIASDGSFDASGAQSLIPGVSPSSPFLEGLSGFCRDGDGAFPSAQYPNCVFNLSVTAPAASQQTLTFVVQGDGTTDGFFAGAPTGVNTVPEPATSVLMATGLLALGLAVRRRASST